MLTDFQNYFTGRLRAVNFWKSND